MLRRTGLVTVNFFVELSDVLDRLSTYVDTIVLTADVNMHLERASDPIPVTSLLKRPDLYPADVKPYRPFSNFSIISKLLERVVSKQLVKYLEDNDMLTNLQSAYSASHLTETAVLKVLADTLLARDSGDLALLTLFDLSAAVDSVDYDTLRRRRLQTFKRSKRGRNKLVFVPSE